MSDEIKKIISNYNKTTDLKNADIVLQHFNNKLKQSSTLAVFDDSRVSLETSNTIQLWYLESIGDSYKVSVKVLKEQGEHQILQINRSQTTTTYNWESFTKDWDYFWQEWLQVSEQKHNNNVVSVSVSAKLVASNYDIDVGSRCSNIENTSVSVGAYIEGGIAWDSWNVGVYGNLGAFFDKTTVDVLGKINKITLTTSNRINGLEEYSKELTADIGINICWLWNVNNLVDMYGVGHAKSWSLGPVSGNLFHNNSGQMCGLGFGYSVKSISIPVGFASWTNTNHGYIMTPTEYSLFVAGLPPLLVPHLAISSIMSLVGDSNINDNEAFDNPITTISSFVPYPGNKNIMITEKALQRYEKYDLIKK